MREKEVAKKIDNFLVSEELLERGFRFKAFVEVGEILDHRSISLPWMSTSDSPPTPLKISQLWCYTLFSSPL